MSKRKTLRRLNFTSQNYYNTKGWLTVPGRIEKSDGILEQIINRIVLKLLCLDRLELLPESKKPEN